MSEQKQPGSSRSYSKVGKYLERMKRSKEKPRSRSLSDSDHQVDSSMYGQNRSKKKSLTNRNCSGSKRIDVMLKSMNRTDVSQPETHPNEEGIFFRILTLKWSRCNH